MSKASKCGFLVQNNSGYSKEFDSMYLQKREELFGYAQTFPEIRIDMGTDSASGVKKIRLKNAVLGLLKTFKQAEELMDILKPKFIEHSLEIICIEYDEAEYIQWYTKDGIETNKE